MKFADIVFCQPDFQLLKAIRCIWKHFMALFAVMQQHCIKLSFRNVNSQNCSHSDSQNEIVLDGAALVQIYLVHTSSSRTRGFRYRPTTVNKCGESDLHLYSRFNDLRTKPDSSFPLSKRPWIRAAILLNWLFPEDTRTKIVEPLRTDPFSVPGSAQCFGDGQSHNGKCS